MTSGKKAVIIGAGPAGLTAAFELLERTDIVPVVLESSNEMGGIAKTVNYKGNRMDIGGHRFFSKSDRVMNWWQALMPIQGASGAEDVLTDVSYQRKTRAVQMQAGGPNPDEEDVVMLVRNRLSRIYFLRRFFAYPISLSLETLSNLGVVRTARIGASYLHARLFPREERSLEDFFINRFGEELYATFFRDYTEKVWGVPCTEIKPEWGAQRIKGISVSAIVLHAMKNALRPDTSIAQKHVETSLIEQFLYPKLGPGQMWELVADLVRQRGGTILTGHRVTEMQIREDKIAEVSAHDEDGEVKTFHGDYVFSTMPVKDLVAGMRGNVPQEVRDVASGLVYRDFITVGLLLRKLKISEAQASEAPLGLVPDNWIYIQEPEVKLGRLQIFNNWSPYMVANPDTVWMGLEYFCNEGDELWSMNDDQFAEFAARELASIDIIDERDVLDSTVIRVPKTYPSYTGSYAEFDTVRRFTDSLTNLFLIGRNGMHRYNNQDHSMLTAMISVDNIIAGESSKANVWDVNTEEAYHEQK